MSHFAKYLDEKPIMNSNKTLSTKPKVNLNIIDTPNNLLNTGILNNKKSKSKTNIKQKLTVDNEKHEGHYHSAVDILMGNHKDYHKHNTNILSGNMSNMSTHGGLHYHKK